MSAPSVAVPSLQAAVAAVRMAFAGYRIEPPLVVCTCPSCMTEAQAKRLATVPIPDLPAADIAEYINSAHDMTLPAARDQLKALLPRIVEIAATGAWPSFDTEHAFVKLARAGFPDWPEAETAAVRGFFLAYLFAILTGERDDDVPAVLAAYANAGDDVGRYLAAIDADESETVTMGLVRMIAEIYGLPDGRASLGNACWPEAAFARFTDWLLGPVLGGRLMEAAMHAQDPEVAAEIARAYDAVVP